MSTKLGVWSYVSCITTLELEDMETGQHNIIYTNYNKSGDKKESGKILQSPSESQTSLF